MAVIIIFVGVVGYFVLVKKSEPITSQPSSISTTPTPISNLCKTETYMDNRTGFSVAYPSSWGTPTSSDGWVSFRNTHGNAKYLIDNPSIDYMNITFDYTRDDAVKSRSMENVANYLSANPDFQKKQVTLDGKSAIITSYTELAEYEHGSEIVYSGPSKPYIITNVYATIDDGKILTISYGKPKNEAVACSFDTLLSTFRFSK